MLGCCRFSEWLPKHYFALLGGFQGVAMQLQGDPGRACPCKTHQHDAMVLLWCSAHS